MTIFSSSFHMLQAFLNLVWNSFLWILAFHIYHVILCGNVPLIIVPGVIRICRLWLARKGVFDGKDPSACSGMRCSSYCMVIFLSDVLKLEDWHRWFYFLFLLYILESITYLILYLTRQMFLIIHLIITHLGASCLAFVLQILKSALCLWMGIFMGIYLFDSGCRKLWDCPYLLWSIVDIFLVCIPFRCPYFWEAFSKGI